MKRVGKKILAFGMIFFGLALFLYPTIQTQEINIKSSPYIKEVDKINYFVKQSKFILSTYFCYTVISVSFLYFLMYY